MPSLFVPGKLVNPLNGAHGHWAAKAAYRKRWRESIRIHLYAARNTFARTFAWTPKRIHLHAHTWGHLDLDGLAAACKPILDGCVDAGLIHSDAPDSGHEITYSQEINRKRRGVLIEWECANAL